jgi:hypothetical protein
MKKYGAIVANEICHRPAVRKTAVPIRLAAILACDDMERLLNAEIRLSDHRTPRAARNRLASSQSRKNTTLLRCAGLT